MTTKYITPESPKELADYIDTLDNVKSISMTLNQFVRFSKAYKLGFKYNQPTYKDIPILIKVGNANNIVSVELQ